MEEKSSKLGEIDGINILHDKHLQSMDTYIIGRKSPSYLMSGSMKMLLDVGERSDHTKYSVKYEEIVWIAGGWDSIENYIKILKKYKEVNYD
jgi:hypothetical protein